MTHWLEHRSDQLDELLSAHSAIGGNGRGRRYATQQVNHAYAMLLSSQFQGFCRDLHSESVDHLVHGTGPPQIQQVLRTALLLGRKLDQGNPNPGNLGSDFNRLGLSFWASVQSLSPLHKKRQKLLEDLNLWRNAIAHQDFDPQKLGGTTLHLGTVKEWRNACNRLAAAFDRVLATHIHGVVGSRPW